MFKNAKPNTAINDANFSRSVNSNNVGLKGLPKGFMGTVNLQTSNDDKLYSL